MSQDLYLDEISLIRVLEQATNHADAQNSKLAEEQLKKWETQPNFHFYLQSIYLDLSLPLNIRWVAIIQFKNGLEKYWRLTRTNAIPVEEKQQIRSRLFDMLDEQNNQLCIQNAQAVSRIARIDFPQDWPELLEFLHAQLSNEQVWKDTVKIYNLLIIINQVVKMLSMAKIGKCRPAYQKQSISIFPLLAQIYLHYFEQWTSTASELDQEETLSSMHISYLACKVLRRLCCDGFQKSYEVPEVVEFMKISSEHFNLLVSKHDQFNLHHDQYEKFIICFLKLWDKMNGVIGLGSSQFLFFPSAMGITTSLIHILLTNAEKVYNEQEDAESFWEQLAIRSFSILKKILNYINSNKSSKTIVLKHREDTEKIKHVVSEYQANVFNTEFMTTFVDLLINYYMKLRPIELENWAMDPEEWVNEELDSSYQYQIRPCAENFFTTLTEVFKDSIPGYILSKLNEHENYDFLTKDSLFAGFQLSAYSLADHVDFDEILPRVFLSQLIGDTSGNTASEIKIIIRRICLIIGAWCEVKCSSESRLLIYQFLVQVLMSFDDKVVQMSAIQCLRTVVDDYGFVKESFEPFLKNFIDLLLYNILPNVSLTQTRLYVLKTITDVVIQTRPLIDESSLVSIMKIVPDLWASCTKDVQQSILANELLRMITNIVRSLNGKSFLTWEVSMPMVDLCCNASPSNAELYTLLSEDGFELLNEILDNYPSEETNLEYFQQGLGKISNFLKYLMEGIENRTEILPTLLEVYKNYAIILPVDVFVSTVEFETISSLMARNLFKLRDDSYDIVLKIWDVLLLKVSSTNPDEHGINAGLSIIEWFYRTGILNVVTTTVFLEESLSSYQLQQLFAILSRINYINPEKFFSFLVTYHQMATLPKIENANKEIIKRSLVYQEMTFDQVFDKFVFIWVESLKTIYNPKEKKLQIISLSKIFQLLGTSFFVNSSNEKIMLLQNFNLVGGLWSEFMEEIREDDSGDCNKYHEYDEYEDEYIVHKSMNYLRLQKLDKFNNPCFHVNFKRFILDVMTGIKRDLSEQEYQQFEANFMDPVIKENIQMFLGY
ncbi:hypothetical protein ACO0QE_002432 [Hanseniaspora vineae]